MTPDTIPALIRARGQLGEHIFLVADNLRLSYCDAESRSRRIASALLEAGVGRGSRVSMLFGNGPDFAVCFLAVTRIGAVAMPISTLCTAHEIRGMLKGADAEYLIAVPDYRGKDLSQVVAEAIGADPLGTLLLPELPVLRRIWFGTAGLEAEGAADDPCVASAEAQVAPADAMVVIHTSGSTSAPKGVTHTHGQILRNMARLNIQRDFTDGDCLLSNSPWFWVGGLAFSFIATLVAGAKLVCSAAAPADMLDLIEAERPTMTNGVASTMLALARDPSFASRDFSFMRRGNLYPIMPPDVRPADPELRYNLLGMTEMGSVCLMGPHEDDLPEPKRGSFGRPVAGIETRIVDPETGEDAASGEMWARGANVMQGYYGRERHECFDADGWFHTGDMVSVDADGDYFFKGREGDIVRTSGAQVSPREVEGAISEATGGRMSIVIGIPDPERGQLVTAILVGDQPVDPAALRTALKARLSPYKIPRKFLTIQEKDLPTVSSGKIDLMRLAQMAADMTNAS
jgi:acyl-CoA synthetase (AMP-forming)/AMP-acid ligase II